MRMRFKLWLWQFLLAVDQLMHVWISGWLYVWLGRGTLPLADETISSRVGRAAVQGKPWALFLESVINAIFDQFGDHDHCRRSIEWHLHPGAQEALTTNP
jgi:hypothetical protein